MGKHRRNELCNNCGKQTGEDQGDPEHPGESVSLLIDLEEYDDKERIWQAPRGPDNPLPAFLVWCVGCSRRIAEAGDPILTFREIGYPEGSDDGPYAQYLRKRGRGLYWQKREDPR